MTSPVVCNSSPIIALEQIGQLDLLKLLFDEISVPHAVVQETAPSVVLPSWITKCSLSNAIPIVILRNTLGKGEIEAIRETLI